MDFSKLNSAQCLSIIEDDTYRELIVECLRNEQAQSASELEHVVALMFEEIQGHRADVDALRREITRLTKRNGAIAKAVDWCRGALLFYADEDNWLSGSRGFSSREGVGVSRAQMDLGRTAKEVLRRIGSDK